MSASNSKGRNIHSSFTHLALHTAIAMSLTTLAGCQTMSGAGLAAPTKGSEYKFSASIPADKLNTMPRIIAAEGIRALDEGKYADASVSFNKALKMDITNPYLNFLNARTYHLRGVQGESQYLALAEEGYKLAIQFDPANAAAFDYLGQMYFEQRRFAAARDQFALASILQPEDKDILYRLAAASYYSHDPVTAEAAFSQLRAMYERKGANQAGHMELLRASAMNKAALNEPGAARAFFDKYQTGMADKSDVQRLNTRLDYWADAYQTAAKPLKVANTSSPLISSPTFQPSPEFQPSPAVNPSSQPAGSATNAGSDFVDAKMVVVDVVIIGTEEDSGTSMGVNLLKGLQLQFGNPFDQTPAYSKQHARLNDKKDPTLSTDTKTITSLITLPAVTYSLNIANAESGRNQVLAQPTLVARSGQTSEFFSGVDISAAATSGGNGDSVQVQKEVGVKMTITPQFAPNDIIFLNVVAERTFLTQPSSSVVFTYRLDTSKTTVNAHVAMKLGQTLILSGLSEKETESNRDGVPYLQDIPILQYAFARKTSRQYTKSIIIMLTPRKAEMAYDPYAEAGAEEAPYSEAVERLHKRHPNWFPNNSNLKTIFKSLDHEVVFNEFRSGDMGQLPEGTDLQRQRRMKEVLNFLYF